MRGRSKKQSKRCKMVTELPKLSCRGMECLTTSWNLTLLIKVPITNMSFLFRPVVEEKKRVKRKKKVKNQLIRTGNWSIRGATSPLSARGGSDRLISASSAAAPTCRWRCRLAVPGMPFMVLVLWQAQKLGRSGRTKKDSTLRHYSTKHRSGITTIRW